MTVGYSLGVDGVVAIPEYLVEPVQRLDLEAFAVLADWLTEHDDPRAEAVRVALEVRAGRADRAEVHRAVAAAGAAILPPLTHPGVHRRSPERSDGAVQAEVELVDGLVMGLWIPLALGTRLHEVLDHPAAQLVRTLTVRSVGADVAWPARCLAHHLDWTILAGHRWHRDLDVSIGADRWPRLSHLSLHTPPGAAVTVAVPALRALRLEQPRASGPVLEPLLDVPALERLEWVTPTVVRDNDPAVRFWRRLLDVPPAALVGLELRPASVARVDELAQSTLWSQLRQVTLGSVGRDLVRWLDRAVVSFDHLDHVEITTVSPDVARALRAWLAPRAQVLPPFSVRHVGPRPTYAAIRSAGG